MYTLQGPQGLGWAACECPLHCPDPFLLRATSTKSSVGMGQTGYVCTTHWFLLHSTLNTTVHFNGTDGTAYTRLFFVWHSYCLFYLNVPQCFATDLHIQLYMHTFWHFGGFYPRHLTDLLVYAHQCAYMCIDAGFSAIISDYKRDCCTSLSLAKNDNWKEKIGE